MKHFFLAAVFGLGVASAAQADGMFAEVGTLGAGLGYQHSLTDKIGARVGFNVGKFSADSNDAGTKYNGDIKFQTVEAVVDYFPIADSNFRLTGGLMYNNNKISLNASKAGSTTVTINNVTYTANNPSLKYEGRMDKSRISPYLGIGWSSKADKADGLHFTADVGVLFQRPDAKLTVSGVDDPSGTLEADRAAAQQKLQDNMNKLKAYPVVKLGMSYSF